MRYRVSDGVVSEDYEADTPEAALEMYFRGYDWGECVLTRPALGESRVREEYAHVYDADDVEVLTVHQSEIPGAPVEGEQEDESVEQIGD